jgi:hypothetical protein
MLFLAATLLVSDVSVTFKAKQILADGKPVDVTSFTQPSDAMCKQMGGLVSFADKNKPVPNIDAADATPWREVFNVLQIVKGCDYERATLRGKYTLRVGGTGAALSLVVLGDKKAKIVSGGTFADFSVEGFKIARGPSDDVVLTASDTTTVKAITDLLQSADITNAFVLLEDKTKFAGVATVLNLKPASDAKDEPVSTALVAAFAKPQQVLIESRKAPAWTQIETAICLLDGKPMVWGVGMAKIPDPALAMTTAENRGRAAVATLLGTKAEDGSTEATIKGLQVVDRFKDARGHLALLAMHAPDALQEAATAPCPTSEAEVKWAAKPIKDAPKPAWQNAKATVSFVQDHFLLKLPAGNDARLAASAAKAQLQAVLATAALTTGATCLTEAAWPVGSEFIEGDSAGAWLSIYEVRKQGLAKKCSAETLAAFVKEAGTNRACRAN